MSKTKFPHPSAPTIAAHSQTKRTTSTSPTAIRKPTQPLHQQQQQRRHPGTGGGKCLTALAAYGGSGGHSDSEELSDYNIDGAMAESGAFAVKPRGSKGGRRGPGQHEMPLSIEDVVIDDNEDEFDFPRGGIDGPRPVYCVCRRGVISGERMLECTDCKELFHGSCVGVPLHSIREIVPLYVCESCLQQHPRRKRTPGTILGVGTKIVPKTAPKKSKKKRTTTSTFDANNDDASDDDENDIIYLRAAVSPQNPLLSSAIVDPTGPDEAGKAAAGADGGSNVAATFPLPAANQAALAAFMSAASGDMMDDDDICPICEDECTCGNSRSSNIGATSTFAYQNDDLNDKGDGGPLMPLFSQVSMPANLATAAAAATIKKRGSTPKKISRKLESRITNPVAATKARAKPRAKKGKGSERRLISRLVNSMGTNSALQSDLLGSGDEEEGVEYELFESGSLSGFPDATVSLTSSDDEDFEFAAFPSAKPKAKGTKAPRSVAGRPLKSAAGSFTPVFADIAPPSPQTKATANPTKRGRPPKLAAAPAATANSAVSGASSWENKKKKGQPITQQLQDLVVSQVYEIDATVIRGRDRRQPVNKRGVSPIRAPSEALSGEDEFVNITDVTSDTSADYPSETEFDLPSTQDKEPSIRTVWSDTNSHVIDGDDDDEDIEKAEEAYLAQMQDNDFSSSSLSDLDEERLAGIRRDRMGDLDPDSGDESDSESNNDEGSERLHARRRKRSNVRRQRSRLRDFTTAISSASDSDSLSDIGSLSSLSSSDEESESDQELTFREAQTEEERALVEYAESGDDREDALLSMHLDQLRAVRNVIHDCSSSPLLEHAGSGSEVASDIDMDMEIAFTYCSRSTDDSSDDLSDDLMEGWGTDARRRWEAEPGSSSDSALSESKLNRLRLKGDEDENHSDLYSSDSYDEFYTRSAFLDMGSDDGDNAQEDAMYPSGLDLDSASLALGVALSMEQQGYSKEDAAAAAAVAAAAYPGAGAAANGNSVDDILGKQVAMTTITASMNANGEADPIDGIMSIKSSSAARGTSRMATGTHTPYLTSEWRAAAAAVAAVSYLDSTKPPVMSYVLPKDLNEARHPSIALAAATAAEAEAEADALVAAVVEAAPAARSVADLSDGWKIQGNYGAAIGSDDSTTAGLQLVIDNITGSAATTANAVDVDKHEHEAVDEDNDEGEYEDEDSDEDAYPTSNTSGHSVVPSPKSSISESAMLPSAFTSQLPNSSFFKPLSSICSPIHRTSSTNAAAIQSARRRLSVGPASASTEPIPSADNMLPLGSGFVPGAPLVSLAEVNAALSALAEQSTSASPLGSTFGLLKRKLSESSIGESATNEEKRVCGNDIFAGMTGKAADVVADQLPLDLSMLFATGTTSSDIANALGRPRTPQDVNPTVAMGAGTPMRSAVGMLAVDHDAEDDIDSWMMSMDQLVDTDALLIKSPPPSPADSTAGGMDAGGMGHLPPIGSVGGRIGGIATTGSGTDLFARWDRIPVNIFRRSRALASNHRRQLSSDDMLGTASSLALTAIKSSRQRRTLINTTLLAQHTLPAEAAMQQHAMKLAMRNGRRGLRNPELHISGMALPPPPPPTPLSSIAGSAQRETVDLSNPAALISPMIMLQRNQHSQQAENMSAMGMIQAMSTGISGVDSVNGAGVSGMARADSQHERHRQLVASGVVTEPGTPWETLSQHSDHSEVAAASAAAARLAGDSRMGTGAGDSGGMSKDHILDGMHDVDMAGLGDDGDGCGYAFGWLEDDEDLGLFAMPKLSTGSSRQQPSMTMVLASTSPMLMPFMAGGGAGSGSGGGAGAGVGGSSSGDFGSEAHHL
ncbi:hypothetical protein LPJ66_003250 [Kickxella alabastrina]|uniref:Uncharacterized protein n=1 Tax=Kickxella alabastrina TaxID=61397 RepID=A0ACC1IMI6_9FUNG|nr:hypothetical protein LPJ66_003250 [Kickxella alabastrina]